MFTTVKSLTCYIDRNIGYVNEAKANKAMHEETKYNEYMVCMEDTLKGQLEKLKSISTNKSLIVRYEKKIANAFD